MTSGEKCPPETTPNALIAIITEIPNAMLTVNPDAWKNGDLSTPPMHPINKITDDPINSAKKTVMYHNFLSEIDGDIF